MTKRGKCIIFSAPSGSGKSTIINHLISKCPKLHLTFSISATSRQPRGKERDGVEYFFLSPEEFRQKIEQGELLEYEEVYPGRFYGTLRSQVEQQLNNGQNVLLDVDVKGGINIKQQYGNEALSIFIQPPSMEELQRRLTQRATDNQEQINNRLAKAEYEMSFAPQFDCVIMNDDLNKAVSAAAAIITDFLTK